MSYDRARQQRVSQPFDKSSARVLTGLDQISIERNPLFRLFSILSRIRRDYRGYKLDLVNESLSV